MVVVVVVPVDRPAYKRALGSNTDRMGIGNASWLVNIVFFVVMKVNVVCVWYTEQLLR